MEALKGNVRSNESGKKRDGKRRWKSDFEGKGSGKSDEGDGKEGRAKGSQKTQKTTTRK